MKKWKCCIKEPSETGKKVIVQRQGDFYVAMRIGKRYIPMPFADHYFCSHLCYPETWIDITFPDKYTGHTRIALHEEGYSRMLTLAQLEVEFPERFKEFSDMLIASIASLPDPRKGNK